jgi:hypothetical protein
MPKLEPFFLVRSVSTSDDLVVLLVVGEGAAQRTVSWAYHTRDRENWERTGITNELVGAASAVLAGRTAIVAVGSHRDRGTTTPAAWISEDGGPWTAAAIQGPSDVDAWVDQVHAVGDAYVAIGSYGEGKPTAWWSPDGRTWELLAGLPEHRWPGSDSIRTAAIGSDRIVLAGQVSGGAPGPVVWIGRAP